MATFNLYSNLDDSNSVSNLLFDFYRSQDDYDPIADYAIFRSSQTDYYLVYGDLRNGGSYKSIRYTNNNTGSYSLSYSSGSDLTINSNGYHFIGSIPGSSSSALADTYKTNYFIIFFIVIISILVLFRLFRRRKDSTPKTSVTIK